MEKQAKNRAKPPFLYHRQVVCNISASHPHFGGSRKFHHDHLMFLLLLGKYVKRPIFCQLFCVQGGPWVGFQGSFFRFFSLIFSFFVYFTYYCYFYYTFCNTCVRCLRFTRKITAFTHIKTILNFIAFYENLQNVQNSKNTPQNPPKPPKTRHSDIYYFKGYLPQFKLSKNWAKKQGRIKNRLEAIQEYGKIVKSAENNHFFDPFLTIFFAIFTHYFSKSYNFTYFCFIFYCSASTTHFQTAQDCIITFFKIHKNLLKKIMQQSKLVKYYGKHV